MTSEANTPLPPNGLYAAKLDSRGRLRLPAAVEGFLRTMAPEGKLFVTTLDGRTGQIYPLQVWTAWAEALTESPAHRRVARDVLFVAHHAGEDVCIDPTGRFLLPTRVRDALGASQQRVYLECNLRGSVTIHSQEQMEQKIAECNDAYAKAIRALSEL